MTPTQPPPASLREIWTPLANISLGVEFRRRYLFKYMPTLFPHRLVVKLLHFPLVQCRALWRDGAIFKFDHLSICFSPTAKSDLVPSLFLLFDRENSYVTVHFRVVAMAGGVSEREMEVMASTMIEKFETQMDRILENHFPATERAEVLVACRHCYTNPLQVNTSFGALYTASCRAFFSSENVIDPIDGRSSTLFSLETCMKSVISESPFIDCDGMPVQVGFTAPDVALSYINNIEQSRVAIGKQIGRGGFGLVYDGTLDGSIVVALKELQNSLSSTKTKFREFRREATIMAVLNHPNIVRLHGVRFHPEMAMVMEYVPFGALSEILDPFYHMNASHDFEAKFPGEISVQNGEPLGVRVLDTTNGVSSRVSQERGDHQIFVETLTYQRGWVPLTVMDDLKGCPLPDSKLPPDLRLKIAVDITAGMQYLHSMNPPILHGDLRSTNVFVASMSCQDAVVAKVADFGLAESVFNSTNSQLATWQWLAPEVLDSSSRGFDERSDIYSFGIVLWELWTRCSPYMEDYWERFARKSNFNHFQCISAILNEGIRPVIPEQVPAVIRLVIEQCFKQYPDQRPSFTSIHRCFSDADLVEDSPDVSMILPSNANLSDSIVLLPRAVSEFSANRLDQTRESSLLRSVSGAGFSTRMANFGVTSEAVVAPTFPLGEEDKTLGRVKELPESGWAAVVTLSRRQIPKSGGRKEPASVFPPFCSPIDQQVYIALQHGVRSLDALSLELSDLHTYSEAGQPTYVVFPGNLDLSLGLSGLLAADTQGRIGLFVTQDDPMNMLPLLEVSVEQVHIHLGGLKSILGVVPPLCTSTGERIGGGVVIPGIEKADSEMKLSSSEKLPQRGIGSLFMSSPSEMNLVETMKKQQQERSMYKSVTPFPGKAAADNSFLISDKKSYMYENLTNKSRKVLTLLWSIHDEGLVCLRRLARFPRNQTDGDDAANASGILRRLKRYSYRIENVGYIRFKKELGVECMVAVGDSDIWLGSCGLILSFTGVQLDVGDMENHLHSWPAHYSQRITALQYVKAASDQVWSADDTGAIWVWDTNTRGLSYKAQYTSETVECMSYNEQRNIVWVGTKSGSVLCVSVERRRVLQSLQMGRVVKSMSTMTISNQAVLCAMTGSGTFSALYIWKEEAGTTPKFIDLTVEETPVAEYSQAVDDLTSQGTDSTLSMSPDASRQTSLSISPNSRDLRRRSQGEQLSPAGGSGLSRSKSPVKQVSPRPFASSPTMGPRLKAHGRCGGSPGRTQDLSPLSSPKSSGRISPAYTQDHTRSPVLRYQSPTRLGSSDLERGERRVSPLPMHRDRSGSIERGEVSPRGKRLLPCGSAVVDQADDMATVNGPQRSPVEWPRLGDPPLPLSDADVSQKRPGDRRASPKSSPKPGERRPSPSSPGGRRASPARIKDAVFGLSGRSGRRSPGAWSSHADILHVGREDRGRKSPTRSLVDKGDDGAEVAKRDRIKLGSRRAMSPRPHQSSDGLRRAKPILAEGRQRSPGPRRGSDRAERDTAGTRLSESSGSSQELSAVVSQATGGSQPEGYAGNLQRVVRIYEGEYGERIPFKTFSINEYTTSRELLDRYCRKVGVQGGGALHLHTSRGYRTLEKSQPIMIAMKEAHREERTEIRDYTLVYQILPST